MKRSQLRRMSSCPLPELEIENLKIEEPENCEAITTGDKIVYTIRHCSFGIDGSDQLEFVVEGPSGIEGSEAFVEEHPKLVNAVTVSIVPLRPGDYQLFIYHRGEKFFTGKIVNVKGNEIIPEEIISKVRIVGPYSKFGHVDHINEFIVDATECSSSIGGIFASIKGLTPRTAAKLYLSDNQNGIYTIGYKPTLAGDYLMRIRMLGLDCPGTPLKIHAN